MVRVLALVFLIMLVSCKRDKLDDCYTSAGEIIVDERWSNYFEIINLYDDVNLVLEPGDNYSIRVEGGKNLIDAVVTEVRDSILYINNTMSCNWVRSYDHKLTVYVTSPSLKKIRFESNGVVSTSSRLVFDVFEINAWGGGGSINIEVECRTLHLALHYGTVDFNVKGKSIMTTIYANSYGPFYCSELNSNIVYIHNNGTNNCYVHANHILGAEITSVGDIYYSGDPYELNCTVTGSGKLIKMK
jgi:hypothetical protein